MRLPVHLAATAVYLPRRRVPAEELDEQLGWKPGTAYERNRVRHRYFVSDDETASFMGSTALAEAMDKAGCKAWDLDAILFTGVMSEQPMPSTAILIHKRLGCRVSGTTCLDVNASCAGFLKATEIAASGIHSGLWRRVGVVSVELSSKGLRWDDPDTCTLFGDGAAAAIFEAPEGGSDGAILAIRSETYSGGADFCQMRAGGSRFNVRTPPEEFEDYLFQMKSRPLLRLVQQQFPRFLEEILAEARDQHHAPVRLVIPHQASAVGLAFLAKQLEHHQIPHLDILSEFGNQVSASIPFALHHSIARNLLHRGDTALLVGTAAGVTFSATLLNY